MISISHNNLIFTLKDIKKGVNIVAEMIDMETQIKVQLYLKRNEQNTNGFCPLMGKIIVSGKKNLTEENLKKDKDDHLWIETARQKTGTPKILYF